MEAMLDAACNRVADTTGPRRSRIARSGIDLFSPGDVSPRPAVRHGMPHLQSRFRLPTPGSQPPHPVGTPPVAIQVYTHRRTAGECPTLCENRPPGPSGGAKRPTFT